MLFKCRLITNANVAKLLLRSQTFMKTSKNFMEKMTKGMYYSYEHCVLQLLLDRVSFFWFSKALSSYKCGVEPCCVLLTHALLSQLMLLCPYILDCANRQLSCISKCFQSLKWTLVSSVWPEQPNETPLNMSLMLWEYFDFSL